MKGIIFTSGHESWKLDGQIVVITMNGNVMFYPDCIATYSFDSGLVSQIATVTEYPRGGK